MNINLEKEQKMPTKEEKIAIKNRTVAILAFVASIAIVALLFGSGVFSKADTNSKDAWTSSSPNLRLELDQPKNKVYVTLVEATPLTPAYMKVIFQNKDGSVFPVELKTMDVHTRPVRYEGSYSRMESMIGFELSIPFSAEKPTVLKSKDLVRVSK